MSAAAYRARSATELIDATFQLLRRNSAAFYTLAAMFAILNMIVNALFLRTTPFGQPQQPLGAAMPSMGGLFFAYLCTVALSALFHTAMMILASDAYLGKPVVVADSLKQAVGKWPTLFFAFLITTVLFFVGLLLFIVGGIYVALALFAVPSVILFENAGVGKAISRSSTLSKELKGHIFLTLLLAGLIMIVAYVIVIIVAGLVSAIPYAALVIEGCALALLVPIYPIVAILIYYDARIRKEGFDIELMAQQVGGAAAATRPQPA